MIARRMTIAGTALVFAAALGCEPYRIEYHRRPAFYQQMSRTPLPDRIELDDGTVILYNADPGSAKALAALRDDGDADEKRYQIREEKEDGTVVLRGFLPEHVITNVLYCLRTEEYMVIWDQLIAEQSKLAYGADGQGPEDFIAFCEDNRIELAKMLNRMRMSFASHEVVVDKRENGVIECRFWPQVGKLFRFRRILMVREGFDLKVAAIK